MDNPLNTQNLRDINAALLKLNDAFTLADQLEAIGEDVTEMRADLQMHKEKLEAMKRVFFQNAR